LQSLFFIRHNVFGQLLLSKKPAAIASGSGRSDVRAINLRTKQPKRVIRLYCNDYTCFFQSHFQIVMRTTLSTTLPRGNATPSHNATVW